MAGGASAQGIATETYLDLARCEGFYLAQRDAATNEAGKNEASANVVAVRAAKTAHYRNDMETQYGDAVASARRAYDITAKAGEERLSAFVARRNAYCQAILASVQAFE